MPVDHALIRAKGWSQGSVLTAEAGSAAVAELPSAQSRVVVVSQDCDIVHAGTHEPYVEVCIAQPVAHMDGALCFARNPRRLHLELTVDGLRVPYQFHAALRRFVDRSALENSEPDPGAVLEAADVDLLARWLAKRYVRAALPDRFNDRIRQAEQKIRKALRNDGRHLTAIFFGLSTEEELEDDTAYEVAVYGLIHKGDHELPERLAACTKAVANVAAAIDEADGLQVVDFELIPEDEFTVHDQRAVIEFNCEDLSFEQDDDAPMLPVP